MADADVKVITLTITEKGYCLKPGSYELEWSELLEKDLEDLKAGVPSARTAPGLLAAALNARWKAGLGVTVLSCDNLQENGKRIKSCLLDFASKVSPEFVAWLKDKVAFPNSMVDRITPQTKPEGKLESAARFKIEDKCPIVCEDFLLWVIEDNFPYGRPKWEDVAKSLGGACLVVPDVLPYELMKLRTLNGAHQALAFPACLLGHRIVDKALCDDRVLNFTRAYMVAAAKTFAAPPGIDINQWVDQTLARFQNTKVQDQILRLTEDGTNRIQITIVDMVLEDKTMMRMGALIIGAWALYHGNDEDETGVVITRTPDERAATVTALVKAACSKPGVDTCAPLLNAAFGSAAEALAAPLAEVMSAKDGTGKVSIAVALGQL